MGNGSTYHIKLFDSEVSLDTVFGRDIPPQRRGPIELAQRRAELERPASVPSPAQASFRAQLDTLERETVPYFGRNALHLDGAGRLWVIGSSRDSTFADVFVGTRFLGRHLLPCLLPERGIAVNGRWMALRCQSYTTEGDFEIQIYRIEG